MTEQTPEPAAPPARRARRVRRHARRVLLLLAAVVAAAIVSTLSVDLGSTLRGRAERAASDYLHRPMHIGRLSVRLFTGRFELDDVAIEGLTPADVPFLTARRITVAFPWWTVFTGNLVIDDVTMSEWAMRIETFPDGRHSMPKLVPERRNEGPRRFTTTVRMVNTMRGEFTFVDHGTPWGVVCRNLSVRVVRARGEYRGRASFSGGTVQIQQFEPMSASMETGFLIDGGKVHLERIDLVTDGATSVLSGDVDLAHWPEQLYQVHSRVDFAREREIFFAGESWRAEGHGDFDGTFHLFKGGHELKGKFGSERTTVNDYPFISLSGSLLWQPKRFEVTRASARFFGGRTEFDYVLAPLGEPGGAPVRFDASYQGVDLAELTDFLGADIRLAGRASGHNRLEWRLGRFAEHRGGGEIAADPPPGVGVLPRLLPPNVVAAAETRAPETRAFNPRQSLGHVPVGGRVTYEFDADAITLAPSQIATPSTFVAFEGETAYGERSRIPFHVTTSSWQASDRLLAALISTFGSPTGAVPVEGYGEFDGVFLKAFRAPRVEGQFSGHAMRVWDVRWGNVRGRTVVENGYTDVTGGIVTDAASVMRVDGRFSLGFPRTDGGEELNATVTVTGRPLADLRHAFGLDDYHLDGDLSGEFHVYGKYNGPFGFGRLTVDDATAYGERFSHFETGMRFEGSAVRLDGMEATKSTGTITGAALIGWDGTYSFNADGRRIPVEDVQALSYPRAPLSGQLQFTASGTGSFDSPRYEVRGRIADLFAGEEGIGQVTGRINVRGELLTLEVDGASPRLSVTGSGRIALTPQADAELNFRVTDTSLDPYLRFFEPRLSPYATAVASGTVRVVGELFDLAHLNVDARVESLDMKLLDYQLRNRGTIELELSQDVVTAKQLTLVGEGTELDLSGTVDLGTERMALGATGDANLGLLQARFADIRSSGGAKVVAVITGTVQEPIFSGNAELTDGRIRYVALPGIDSINGRISFDAAGIRLDDITGRLGGGLVRFGGRIGLHGYMPGELALTARGERMRLRYPTGFRSEINADLELRGELTDMVLSGTVTILDAEYVRRFEGEAELLDLIRPSKTEAPAGPSGIPLRYDVRLVAPSSLRINNNVATIVASADLTLRGDYDRPLLFGRLEIDQGRWLFEGNRLQVNRGVLDFTNPTRIEPWFDLEVETRVRAPGQMYRVTIRATGTPDRFVPEFSSDPPLPQVDVLSLLLGEVYDPQDAELQALRSRERSEQALASAAARLLTSPISAGVGRAVEQTFGVDSVQITPLVSELTLQSLSPAARVTIGKRISSRAFLTYSRSLNASNRDQIILLEYDQSDRLSWVLSQNEDKTFALDFRVRHVF